MTLTQQQLTQLADDLPLLRFDIAQDCAWPQNPLVQSYLDMYGINFCARFRGTRHGFGRVAVAGFNIAAHYWLPQNPRGTLVILHGYYDHVGIFGHAIEFALQQNLAVLTFDLPGHGLSSGERAAINSFDQYADVLHEVINRAGAVLPQPFHGLGQSTGAAVVLNYLWRYEQPAAAPAVLQKIALVAPLILPRGWGSGRFLFYILRPFVQRLQRGSSRSSHDPDFLRFLENDLLQAKYLSVQWVGAMAQWHNYVLQAAPLYRPVLVVQGTGDMTVAWRYNLKQLRQKLPRASVQLIPGAGHQLINESPEYRNQLLEILRSWFS